MKINRHGSAQWQGGIKDGKGTISTESGALKDYPYGFASRFEDLSGTNQETFEKLAGMAKSGCPVSKLFKANITLDATLVT